MVLAAAELQYTADWMTPRRAQYMRYKNWIWMPLSESRNCLRQSSPTVLSLVATEKCIFYNTQCRQWQQFRQHDIMRACVSRNSSLLNYDCSISRYAYIPQLKKFRMYPSRWIVFWLQNTIKCSTWRDGFLKMTMIKVITFHSSPVRPRWWLTCRRYIRLYCPVSSNLHFESISINIFCICTSWRCIPDGIF